MPSKSSLARALEARGWALAAHAEDALRLGDLGIRAGLRLDAAQAGAAETSTGLRLGVGPRLAITWDVGGRGRQWVLLHAGRSHDVELLGVVRRSVLPQERIAVWSGGAFDGCAGPGPLCVRLGGPATLVPGGLPRTDEIALGWRGRLGWAVDGGVEARWRQSAELWAEQETGASH